MHVIEMKNPIHEISSLLSVICDFKPLRQYLVSSGNKLLSRVIDIALRLTNANEDSAIRPIPPYAKRISIHLIVKIKKFDLIIIIIIIVKFAYHVI